MKKFSNYQQAIFNFGLNGEGNGIVQATAGSGKTTTLVELSERLIAAPRYKGKSFFFGAFNKSIAEELATRLPKTVTVKTLHAFGMSALRKVSNRLEVDSWKYSTILDELIKEKYGLKRGDDQYTELKDASSKLLDFVQVYLIKPDDIEGMLELAYERGMSLPFDQVTRVTTLVTEALITGRHQIKQGKIAFVDMIWGPWALNLKPDQFDFIMLDEVQDLNNAQMDLVKKALAPGGRFLGVGDRFQSIYNFCGANSNSMSILKETFNCQEFPLSITYRCPSSHVKLAKLIDPSITARENAPEGLVTNISEEGLSEWVKPGDMILCRTNAPLVSACFSLLAKGISATIRGRDIGKELSKLVETVLGKDSKKSITPKFFFDKLNDYALKQKEVIQAKFADHPEKQDMYFAMIQDKLDVLTVIFEASQPTTVDKMKKQVESLFSDEASLITLSSIHRSKGLEADRVCILRPELLPFPAAKTPQDQQSEQCLIFVATTRAKKELCFAGAFHLLEQMNQAAD